MQAHVLMCLQLQNTLSVFNLDEVYVQENGISHQEIGTLSAGFWHGEVQESGISGAG